MQFLLLVLRYWLMIYLLFFIFFLNSLELDVRGEFSGELLCVKFIMADLFSNFLHIMRAVDSTAKSCVDHFRVILHIYLVPLPTYLSVCYYFHKLLYVFFFVYNTYSYKFFITMNSISCLEPYKTVF